MANEITFANLSGDLRISAVLHQEMQLLLADRFSLMGHPAVMYMGDLAGRGSTALDVPLVGLDGYDRMAAVGAETAAVSNTALTDSSQTITIARQALRRAITDLASLTDSVGLNVQSLAEDMVGAARMRWQELLCNLMDDFSNTVGTSGVNLSVDDFLDAVFTLEQNSVPTPYLSILHPVQLTDLQNSLRGETGPLQFVSATQEMISAKGQGYAGTFAGVDIYASSLINTANAAADRSGGMFGRGAVAYADGSMSEIIGAGGIQLPVGTKIAVEFERDSAYAYTYITGNYYVGMAELQDTMGVSIITDA
jgi:hypothetical protein